MPHRNPLPRAVARLGRQRWHTEDKTRLWVSPARSLCPNDPRSLVARKISKRLPKPRTTKTQAPGSRKAQVARAATSSHKQPMTTTPAYWSSRFAASGINSSYRSSSAGVRRASRSEPLVSSVHRRGGVPPLLCHQPRRAGRCGAPPEPYNPSRGAPVRHNPSLNRTVYGRPPWPGRW